jgi:SP family xylose:H+ symportor-like MFS transporter
MKYWNMETSKLLLRSTFIAALGGFLFGFDTAVISGTVDSLETVFELSPGSLGFTVASALIGTIFGALSAGWPSDRYGRRKTLFVLAVLFFVSAVGCALCWDWYSFIIFRFLGGLAVGGAMVVSPMYIAEISPAKVRGRMVAINNFNVVLGILLAYFSNYFITTLELGAAEWRWMFGIEAFPAAGFFFLLFPTPLSPRWLIANSRLDEARAILVRLGTDYGGVDEEIQAIQQSLDLDHHGLRERLFCRKYSAPITFAVLIAMFNQLSGINALIYYAPNIFKMAGAATESAMLQSVIIGFTNLVFTMLALIIIDHFGRKRLMLVGSLGYIVSLATVSVAFFKFGTDFSAVGGKVVLGALILYIASHAFGQGTVMLVFISEIFPNRVRARGLALGAFTHWFMAAVISWTFPVLVELLGAGTVFAFYCTMMVLQLIWVLRMMPETKGVPLEEIQKHLGIE